MNSKFNFREKIFTIEKSAGALEKEVTRTGCGLEEVQKNMTRLEQSLHNSETVTINNQRSQILLETQQERLKEESKKLDETVNQLHDKIK